ncbi:GntR family transcriptional regulator [Lacrimispora amygdalina]|uniref:GntR family transcriptional regulator n=1 Tax=Lacrimispora amygdalina TaxID=253257 RepID=A0ABQ5MDJ5_9FIRM
MWGIELRTNSEISLARQIFLSLRKRILTGDILPGELLPSTRELAKGLGTSRNTVCEAYDMLLTEGFIISRQGAPSMVTEGLHMIPGNAGTTQDTKKEQPAIHWNFKTGQPDLSLFPWSSWSQMVHRALNTLPVHQLEYSGPKGYEPLCREISKWLMRSRSMEVNPEDIFITSGATQAFYLLVDILYKKNRPFALENPSHPGIRTVINDRNYPLCFMPVDRQGADVSWIKKMDLSAVYVTPSHQFPLGGILPAVRRASLIRLAAEKDYYIIEDDYDSEYRYSGSPVTPLYSMDPSRVIYVGTFSKTLFPALRIGFAVLPKELQKKWRHFRNYLDVQNPVLEQIALTEFLKIRKMDRHVHHMCRVYAKKRETLLSAAKEAFGSQISAWGDESGLHVALELPEIKFGKDFIPDCRKNGIQIQTISQYCSDENCHTDKLLLGYGHLNEKEIQDGIAALKSLIDASI